ncbi:MULTISPECIES: ribonuclease III [unclassified Lactococcus]|uniref:ribonuclease III n=1 Tax=unclassified Lactococcus TaxID=2643510 RepID=UPI0011CACDBD|nr:MULTISPECIES: ribonuclease III [unclassified Lactococcus]MQW22300.1 ribonuclease III [Lactococcus sp. dk101]TXK45229.1 ribonuclease III [Lactococcus sp. dk310]TXK50993.1 ribonuclease III [Lactococcus sp. dk322]
MNKLQEKLKAEFGIVFTDEKVLEKAFTHSSYTNEERLPKVANNERLEFLGDVALSLVISDYLYRTYPEKLEGELSKMRSSIVRTESLANFSRRCGFGEFLKLGHGEEKMGGRNRETTLENLFEAFLGALFLDQGMEEVRNFIYRVVIPHIKADDYVKVIDYKTELQEILQVNGETIIAYDILEETGPAHARKFVAAVSNNGQILGTGEGRSKKFAEQKAAENAIKGQMHVSE